MKNSIQEEDPIRPHEFDGIQEYDKALPNWWLFTLYGSILFSIGYWIYYHKTDLGPDQHQEYELALLELEASVAEAAKLAPEMTEEIMLAMSQDPQVIQTGETHYLANCAACHGVQLEGPPTVGLPGVSLVDQEWVHGFNPEEIRTTISAGVLEKGMPAWGPVLGDKRIVELVAFILSKQAPGFPDSAVRAAASPTSVAAPPPVSSSEPSAPVSNETLLEISKDPAVLAAGQNRYTMLCVACHGVELQGPPMEGLPGVSLVDAEWLHGNEPMQIRTTILKGVPEKGMVPWEAMVGEQGANELVAYILSKQPQ